jgi:hypothetical protein
MAFFTEDDIAAITASHKGAVSVHLVNKWQNQIVTELGHLIQTITEQKDDIVRTLTSSASHLRTAEAWVDTIFSYDFRAVGGPNATYKTTHTGDLFKGTLQSSHTSFAKHCQDIDPDSWVGGVNRFNIWRTKDFFKTLATCLGLPDNVYFTITSTPMGNLAHFDVPIYENKLMMVYRFSKPTA